MQITKIKLEKMGTNPNVAFKARYSITYNNCITVNSMSLVRKSSADPWVLTFGSFKDFDDKHKDVTKIVNNDFKEEVINSVVKVYENKQEEYVSNVSNISDLHITDFRISNVNEENETFDVNILLDHTMIIYFIKCRLNNEKIEFEYPYLYDADGVSKRVLTFDTLEVNEWLKKELYNIYRKTIGASKIEFKTPEDRKKDSNEKIKKLGIACNENLPKIEASTNVQLKNIDEICKRAICAVLSVLLADAIREGETYEKSLAWCSQYLEKYSLSKTDLNSLERKLFENNYSRQDMLNISWEVETYWALIWALGFINEEIENASDICDSKRAIKIVLCTKDFEDFKAKCYLRNIEDILDMLDLYYRFDWAVVEKRLNPETPIGYLNPSVVLERRRGLEWLISKEDDWYDISLDT